MLLGANKTIFHGISSQIVVSWPIFLELGLICCLLLLCFKVVV